MRVTMLKTGTAKMPPTIPAALKPIKKERITTIGWILNVLPISLGPQMLKINCWITKRIMKIIKALKGSEIKLIKSGGIIAKIGPIIGITVRIPAKSAVEAAKSTEKIRKTIQVTSPKINPKRSWTLKNEAKVSLIIPSTILKFLCHLSGVNPINSIAVNHKVKSQNKNDKNRKKEVGNRRDKADC